MYNCRSTLDKVGNTTMTLGKKEKTFTPNGSNNIFSSLPTCGQHHRRNVEKKTLAKVF
jgi:hypothetical protein